MFVIRFSWTEDRISVVCMEGWDFLQYICWDSENRLWLCDLMGAENAVSISKSSVDSWVGCDMFAETMGACTHVSTSQDGINAFGVKQLGDVICAISTFNSTQCYIHEWFLRFIHTWMKSMEWSHIYLLVIRWRNTVWWSDVMWSISWGECWSICIPDTSLHHSNSHG